MSRIVLRFGLIAGAVLSAIMLVTIPFQEQIGFENGATIGYTTMVVAFLMIYFGVRSYRDTVAGGTSTFGRAVVVGLLITAVATACYVATWELVYYKLAPDFGDKYAAYAAEKARRDGATEAELESQAKEMAEFLEMYKNPLVNMAITAIEPLPVGLVFTVVTAGLISRGRGAAARQRMPGSTVEVTR